MKTQGREKDLKRWGRKQVYKDFYDQEIRKNTVNQYSALQVKNVRQNQMGQNIEKIDNMEEIEKMDMKYG